MDCKLVVGIGVGIGTIIGGILGGVAGVYGMLLLFGDDVRDMRVEHIQQTEAVKTELRMLQGQVQSALQFHFDFEPTPADTAGT